MRQRAYGPGTVEAAKGGFRLEWKDSSGRRRQRIVATDRRAAERLLAQIVSERELEISGLKPQGSFDARFSELSAKFLADLATRVKPRQVDCIEAHLTRLQKQLGNPRVRDITKDAVSSYRQRRLAEGKANATVNLEVGSLRAMCRFGVRMDLLGRNPIEGLPPLPMGKAHEKMPRRPFDDGELQALLAGAAALDAERAARMAAETTITNGTKSKAWGERERPLHIPQAPFLRTLAATGARFAELAATTWGDWSETLRTLTLRAETTKSKKSRRIPLLKSAEDDLRALREIHREGYGRAPKPHEPIFLTPTGLPLAAAYPNMKRFFADAMERAGLDAVSQRRGRLCIHALRHTFASRLARANAGLTQAQMLLGHSTPELTAVVYTHHNDGDLRAAVDRLEGS